MEEVEILGLVAAALTTTAFVPQAYGVWKHKFTKGISLGMYLIFLLGLVLWLLYGIAINSLSIIAANGVTIVLALSIIIAKLKYK